MHLGSSTQLGNKQPMFVKKEELGQDHASTKVMKYLLKTDYNMCRCKSDAQQIWSGLSFLNV